MDRAAVPPAMRPGQPRGIDLETRAHHVLIGLFTLLTFAGALGFALWLGKSTLVHDWNFFEIGFERPVSGLAIGNSVQFSGIRVGDVVGIGLAPDDPRQVRALIRVNSSIPVKEDTQARLAMASVAGNMLVQLQGGSPEKPSLVGSRENPPLIMAEPSTFAQFMQESELVMVKFRELLDNASMMTSEENVARISNILLHLEQVSATLAERRHEMGDTLVQVQAGVAAASETMESLSNAASSVEALLQRHDDSLDQGLHAITEIGPAVRELRASMRTLNRLVQRIEDDPSGFLLGRQGVMEFQP